MSKNKSTAVSTNRQLTLWDGMFDARIRRIAPDGTVHFSILDIFEHYGSEGSASNPTVYWKRVLKRLKEQGSDLTGLLDWRPAADVGGKPTPMVTFKLFLRLAQTTEFKEWEPLRDWMAEIAQERIEETVDPELGITRAVHRATAVYLKQGKTPAWIEDRLDTISEYKLLCQAIDRVCAHPNYGAVVNTEYLGLFGAVADDLKRILHTKSIRDGLPKLQLSYLHTAELGLRQLLEQSSRMNTDDIVFAAQHICEPLGTHLHEMSVLLGVDRVTGVPLLAN